jgi:AbrB family looped-hinge helix DNA binding protein
MTVLSAEMYGKGQITIPKAIRDSNGLKEGTKFTVLDLGEGRLLMEPADGETIRDIHRSFNRTGELLGREGATQEAALAALRRMREAGCRKCRPANRTAT